MCRDSRSIFSSSLLLQLGQLFMFSFGVFVSANDAYSSLRWNVFVPESAATFDVTAVRQLHCSVLNAVGNKITTTLEMPLNGTIGKYIHMTILTAYRSLVHGEGTISVIRMPKNNDIWSRLSSCIIDSDMWACLFGRINIKKSINKCAPNEGRSRPLKFHNNDAVKAVGAIASLIAPRIWHDPSTLRYVHHVDSPSPLNISVHARFGDACELYLSARQMYSDSFWSRSSAGRPCFYREVYMNELRLLSEKLNTKNVLIETDDYDFLRWILTKKEYNYYYMDYGEKRRAYDVCPPSKKPCKLRLEDRSSLWIENRPDLTPAHVDMSVSGLWLLQHGHALIGGFQSHYTRAVYFLMVGRLGYIPPYISLDGGGVIAREKRSSNISVALIEQAGLRAGW